MASHSLIRREESEEQLRRSYGPTIIEDGGNAHLGDILHEVNLNGQVHLHIHNLRQSARTKASSTKVRRECCQSLRALRDAFVAVRARVGSQHQAPKDPTARGVQGLLVKTIEEIDLVLKDEATHKTRPALGKRHLTNRSDPGSATAQKKLLTFCQIVEDRLDMIEFLVQDHNDDRGDCSEAATPSTSSSDAAPGSTGFLLDGQPPSTSSSPEANKSSPTVIKFKLSLTLPSLELSRSDLNQLLTKVSGEAITLWTAFQATLLLCSMKMALFTPGVLPVFLMIRRLPRLLSLGDTFTFYDASNEKAELSVADFRYWDVFKTRLDCKFRNTPGRTIVLNGQFVLTGTHVTDLVITADNWEDCIKEGVTIYMAANLDQQEAEGFCPNPDCLHPLPEYEKHKLSGSICSKCGTVRSSIKALLPAPPPSTPTPSGSQLENARNAQSLTSLLPSADTPTPVPTKPLNLYNFFRRVNVLPFVAPTNGSSSSLDFLRNSPHFQQLRTLIQQQPAMLEPILQQIADGNPQLASMIAANPDEFLQLLSEDGEEDTNLPPGAQPISVTDEEREAIERLIRLGFARDSVIQAYFACDKNEELTANFLFDQPEDDEDERITSDRDPTSYVTAVTEQESVHQSSMENTTPRESAIRDMEALGFERADIQAALAAANFNPDRAIEYLLNGTPSSSRPAGI